MKKIIFSVLSFFVMLGVCYSLLTSGEDVKHNQKPKLKIESPIEKSKVVPILDAINARNSGIKSFVCDDLRTIAQMPNRRPVRLNGSIAYEKEKKFRLELGSILGSELDIGSDSNVFWFWSKRLKDPGLYWAYYKDFNKTKLKTPFNPFWMSHCLGVDPINYQDAVIDSSESKWRVIKNTVNAQNQPVKAVIYVDPQRKLITGHGMYDTTNTLVASSEVQLFDKNGLPSKITFIWHKENASMIWNLHGSQVNISINSGRWVMPDRKPKIDMSRE